MSQSSKRKNSGGAQVARKSRSSAPRNTGGNGATEIVTGDRLPVLKTYKIYIGGKFPRTESGRYYLLKDAKHQPHANICLCSRKDLRDSVVAARGAQSSWAGKS